MLNSVFVTAITVLLVIGVVALRVRFGGGSLHND